MLGKKIHSPHDSVSRHLNLPLEVTRYVSLTCLVTSWRLASLEVS